MDSVHVYVVSTKVCLDFFYCTVWLNQFFIQSNYRLGHTGVQTVEYERYFRLQAVMCAHALLVNSRAHMYVNKYTRCSRSVSNDPGCDRRRPAPALTTKLALSSRFGSGQERV